MVLLQSPTTETLICTQTGESIRLTSLLANGGEGEIWQTSHSGWLAKIYYDPTPDRIRKLKVMVAHPPQDPNAHIGHISYAWPRSLLQDNRGNGVGFLMPEIPKSVDLMDVYHPLRRQKVFPDFSWLYLHVTAANVASLVWAIHHAGYVLGDIKPQNILVNSEGLPGLIDTDSFQVCDPESNELFRCLVGSESFTPPELLGQDLAWIEQTPLHDRFRLGVILYLLLFGEHPFKGQWVGAGDSPSPNELVRHGLWPYAPQSLIQASRLTIPLQVIHPDLQRCFLRCFTAGHTQPEQRPTAQEWVQAFKGAIADLKPCPKVKRHIYSHTHGRCHWCDRKNTLGVDVFPAPDPAVHKALIALASHQKQAQITLKKTIQSTAIAKPPQHNPARITYASTVLPLPQKGILQTHQSPPFPSSPKPLMQRRSAQFGIAMLLGSVLFGLLIHQSSLDAETLGLTIVGVSVCLGLVALCFLLARFSQ
jgi:DNA-binding helix-hairpin-helix protein with protein kinase domain